MSIPINNKIEIFHNSTLQAVQNLPNQINSENFQNIFSIFTQNVGYGASLHIEMQTLSQSENLHLEGEIIALFFRTYNVNTFVAHFLTVDSLNSAEDAFQLSEEAKNFLLTYLDEAPIQTQLLAEKLRTKVEKLTFNNLEVACKTPTDPMRQFNDEAQFQARLDHPHIIKLYTIFKHGDRITQLYLEPAICNLLQVMDVDDNWISESQKFLFQALTALHYLSQRGIIHGDIKPENLLVNRERDLKVADFGCAIYEGEEIDNLCTIPYRPPEVRNVENPYSSKVDIWSLGVVFFEWMKDKKSHAHPSKTMWTRDIKPYLMEEMAPETTYHGENLAQEVTTSLQKISEERRQAFDPEGKICALIGTTMVWSPQERPSAENLLNEFFTA